MPFLDDCGYRFAAVAAVRRPFRAVGAEAFPAVAADEGEERWGFGIVPVAAAAAAAVPGPIPLPPVNVSAPPSPYAASLLSVLCEQEDWL